MDPKLCLVVDSYVADSDLAPGLARLALGRLGTLGSMLGRDQLHLCVCHHVSLAAYAHYQEMSTICACEHHGKPSSVLLCCFLIVLDGGPCYWPAFMPSAPFGWLSSGRASSQWQWPCLWAFWYVMVLFVSQMFCAGEGLRRGQALCAYTLHTLGSEGLLLC